MGKTGLKHLRLPNLVIFWLLSKASPRACPAPLLTGDVPPMPWQCTHTSIHRGRLTLVCAQIAATPRARARLWADQFILYGPEIPNHNISERGTIVRLASDSRMHVLTAVPPASPRHVPRPAVFFLGMVYCCINPIITPVCLLYYTFTVISAR